VLRGTPPWTGQPSPPPTLRAASEGWLDGCARLSSSQSALSGCYEEIKH